MANDPQKTVDPKQAKVVAQWKHERPLIDCRFDPLGRFLVSCSEDFTLQRWALDSGEKVTLSGHQSWPRSLAFTPDGETLFSAGSDEQLLWWSVGDAQPQVGRAVEAAHRGWIRSVSVSPDGRLLASGGNDLMVRLWNTADGTPVRELKGHSKQVYTTLFHPDGQSLLSGDLGGQVHQWDLASGELLHTFEAKDLHTYNKGQGVDYGGVRSLALSPDTTRLACSGLHKATNPLGAVNEPLVMVFDMESRKLVRSHQAEGVRGAGWRTLYHPDGFLIGVSGGSGGGFLLFWKPEEEKEFHKLKLPNTARGMDLHPDGTRVATAHHDGHVRITSLVG